jgi:hypothetical protein
MLDYFSTGVLIAAFAAVTGLAGYAIYRLFRSER